MIDVNDLRITVTVLSFALFMWLAVHTWSQRRRPEYEAAARLPFLDSLNDEGADDSQDQQGKGRAP